MIRIEALRAFVAVAEHGNIRDAAERMARTPSALSMTLKQIEELLGSPLFQSDRKSALTDTGRYLLETARHILRDYDRAMELVLDFAKARRGRLRLASVPSVAVALIPATIETFMKSRPGVQIDLIDTNSTSVRHLVESGEVDLGVAGSMEAAAGTSFTPLFSDRMVLVCQESAAPGTPDSAIAWAQLERFPFILNETTRNLRSAGFIRLAQQSSLTVRNVTSLLAMIQAGMGVTLLPELATANLPPRLTTRVIDDPGCRRVVGIWRRTGHIESPLTAAFATTFARIAHQQAKLHGLENI